MDELQQKIEQAKAGPPQFCATCTKPIDFDSEAVMQSRDGRLWCNTRCASRPKVQRPK